MPISHKIVLECPKYGYTKVVNRGDCLPDVSIVQTCPKCEKMMNDSKKSVDNVGEVVNNILRKLKV